VDAVRETVFGLDVEGGAALPFLAGAAAGATGRRLELTLAEDGAELEWPGEAGLLSDERDSAGEVLFRIEAGERGYRIAGPRYGTAILAADGSRLCGGPGAGGLLVWQRLLIAQALPFAAVLQGLEVLHGSGVAVGGEAFGLLGGSGSGKTSVALALRGLGAEFLADDVLALERDGERLLAHPGAPVAGVDGGEVERLRRLAGFDEELILAEDDREAMVRLLPHPAPLPLAGLFLLERRPQGPSRPCFETVVTPAALLAATFNLVLLGGERFEALLDVCALAAGGLVERVVSGPGIDPSMVAEAVAERIGVPV
jgi:hypothetical protein